MYYIVFYYHDKHGAEIYSGGSYVFQGEKYACFDCVNPKLYKSEKVAENVAKKLLNSCTNTGCGFEVLEWYGRSS